MEAATQLFIRRPGTAGRFRQVLRQTARPAKRAERHERDAPAEALFEKRSRAAVGEVEQVLHANDVGPCDGVPHLFETDIAQAHPGDQVLVAGRHHRCQLVIEARADAPVAGQAKVDRCELADLQVGTSFCAPTTKITLAAPQA